jgi:hypothetical protein
MPQKSVAATPFSHKKYVDRAEEKMLDLFQVEAISMGNRVKILESEVRELPRNELSAFREWFIKFDADEWDRQIEADIQAGKLEKLAAKTLSAHKRGKSREL